MCVLPNDEVFELIRKARAATGNPHIFYDMSVPLDEFCEQMRELIRKSEAERANEQRQP